MGQERAHPPNANVPGDTQATVRADVVEARTAPPPGAGALIAGRYRIEGVVGSGGGGVVLRARDTATGHLVALKTTSSNESGFDREARVLASLQHPAIVRYLDQGFTELGTPYLVMELLVGETLRERLARGPLAPPDACRLVGRLLDALAYAHARGVVHRDVKPSNVFLPAGALDQAKLLDFGVARELDGWRRTLTGQVVGTPLYMAPEQAAGERDVDARADVFAAGCVLVECVTGQPVFAGAGLAGLAKIALSDRVAAEQGLARLPGPLAACAAEMLTHDRDRRPGDAARLSERLAALAASLGEGSASPAVSSPAALGGREARSVVVLLVGVPSRTEGGIPDVRALAERWGAELQQLVSGASVLTFGVGGARDQVARAARAALELRDLAPRVPLSLALGRATVERQAVVGPAIDETTRLATLPWDHDASAPVPIRLDRNAADLLAGRFDVQVLRDDRGEEQHVLVAESAAVDAPRLVLGRTVPFVGRDRELGNLEALIDDCFDDERAAAALVIAPPGGGKSRLRRELVARLGARTGPCLFFTGEPDALRAGAPYGVLGSAIRSAAEIAGTESPDVRRRKLGELIDRAGGAELAPAERQRLEVFLGELAGLAPEQPEPPMLRSALQDPRIMADQVRLAWLDLLELALDRGPVLLALEDLHWGDAPSVQLIEAALKAFVDRPLFVLGLARPEVDDRFPGLFRAHLVERFTLSPLKSRACRDLVRAVLPALPDERLDSLVERAEGNPFFLEELVRVEAGGAGDGAAPPTVLAAVQARLDHLGDDGKRVLRAASIFGESFSREGVEALLDERLRADVQSWLDLLCERELVLPRDGRRRRDDRRAEDAPPLHGGRASRARAEDREPWVFRHALVRDAAYDTLTDGDRRVGHQLAGEFLERTGEHDGVVLAGHFERGGDRSRAARHYRIAAAQALEANDYDGTFERCGRAEALGADGRELGLVRLVECKARNWRGEWELAQRAGEQAVELLEGDPLAEACSNLAIAFAHQQRAAEYRRVFARLERLAGVVSPRIWAYAVLRTVGYHHFAAGEREPLVRVLDQLRHFGVGPDLELRAHWCYLRGQLDMSTGNFARAQAWSEQAYECFVGCGDLREACGALNNVALALTELAQLDEAAGRLQELITLAKRLDQRFILPFALVNLGCLQLAQGDHRAASAAVAEALLAARGQRDSRLTGFCHLLLAQISLAAGDAAEAEDEAEQALSELADVPSLLFVAEAAMARALVELGRVAEARIYADSAVATLRAEGVREHGEFTVWLAGLEVARATGDALGGRALAEDALAAIERRLEGANGAEAQARLLAGIHEARPLAAVARAFGVAFPEPAPAESLPAGTGDTVRALRERS